MWRGRCECGEGGVSGEGGEGVVSVEREVRAGQTVSVMQVEADM